MRSATEEILISAAGGALGTVGAAAVLAVAANFAHLFETDKDFDPTTFSVAIGVLTALLTLLSVAVVLGVDLI